MKVGVVGSRDFEDYHLLEMELDNLDEDIDMIITGGAVGADTLAERYARENLIPVFIRKPDWSLYGKSAGMIRNKEIVERSDMVIAFWNGESRGTKNTIDLCEQTKTPIKVIIH